MVGAVLRRVSSEGCLVLREQPGSALLQSCSKRDQGMAPREARGGLFRSLLHSFSDPKPLTSLLWGLSPEGSGRSWLLRISVKLIMMAAAITVTAANLYGRASPVAQW